MPWPARPGRGADWSREDRSAATILRRISNVCSKPQEPNASLHRQSPSGPGFGRYLRVLEIDSYASKGQRHSALESVIVLRGKERLFEYFHKTSAKRR